MGRKNKQTKNLKQYNNDSTKNRDSKVVNFNQVFETPPNYYEITKAFDFLRPIILELTRTIVTQDEEEMPQLDGSWDHRRDGKLLVDDAVCIETQKIIDFCVKIRITSKRKGNVIVSPQALEGCAFEDILPRLMSNNNILELVKYRDVEINSIIRKSGWMVKVTPDPNYILKHFDIHFENAISPHQNLFRGICEKVLKRLKNILYEDTEKPVKFIKIQEMKQFILTQPFLKLGRAKEKKKWKYSNDKQALIYLDKVIMLCNEIASTFTRRYSTCFNETFHTLKAKYLPKQFNLGNTCDVRSYASILHYNVGDDWLELIYDQLKLPKTYIERLKGFRSYARKKFKEISNNYNYFENEAKKDDQKM